MLLATTLLSACRTVAYRLYSDCVNVLQYRLEVV
jgi:hypothetical protein